MGQTTNRPLEPHGPPSTVSPDAKPDRSRLKQIRRWGGRVCVVAFVTGLAVTALAWLLPLRVGSAWIYESLFAIAFFSRVFLLPMAAGWIALGTLALMCGHRRVGLLSLLLAITWAAPEIWVWQNRSRGVDGPTFAIASINLNKNLKDASAALRSISEMNADMVVCQELSPAIAESLQTALHDRYPHVLSFPDAGYDGAAIFSRGPLQLIESPGQGNSRNLTASAMLDGHAFRLVNVHLSPPSPARKRQMNRSQTLDLIERYTRRPADQPVVLIGDFNFTSFSPQGSALADAGFKDAHRVTGGGRQTTWPNRVAGTRVPRVRIDTAYTFGGGLQAIRTEVGRSVGSDHEPIKVTFAWPRG